MQKKTKNQKKNRLNDAAISPQLVRPSSASLQHLENSSSEQAIVSGPTSMVDFLSEWYIMNLAEHRECKET